MTFMSLERQGVWLPDGYVSDAVQAAAATYVEDAPNNAVLNAVREAAEQDEYAMLGVPATQFALACSLDILRHPDVETQLPSEVKTRADAAKEMTSEVVKSAVKRGTFYKAYERAGLIDYFSSQAMARLALSDRETVTSLGRAAIEDAAHLIGGGVHFMQTQGVPQSSYGDILARSSGLLAFAKVHVNNTEDVHQVTGRPYTYDHNFILDTTPQLKLRFSAGALQAIDLYRGDGCPASKLRAEGGRGSLLQQNWRELATLLAPEYARADQYSPPERP